MDIVFKSRKLEKIFNAEKELAREYGDRCARKIKLRLALLRAADHLEQVPTSKPDRCHELQGKREGQFAVDLVHPFRLIFRPYPKVTDTVRRESVTVIEILDVEDYH